MASDQDVIQGLWRVVSTVARGGPVHSGTTHYLFEGHRVKAITPSLVDGGDWATFELDPTTEPKRLTKTHQWPGRDGRSTSRTHCQAYELDGDTLRICWPNVFGQYPDVVSDQLHGVVTLARDHGPPPATKQPSGKQAVDDPVLGRVTWDDNFDNWEARLELSAGSVVELSLKPGERSDEATLAAGREVVVWVRKHEPAARRYAAGQMLDTHNDNWNDGKPITARTFTSRITLESVAVHPDGGLTLYYKDGELFAGHCIVVSVSRAREFEDATIAG